jgi:hypothetical protein
MSLDMSARLEWKRPTMRAAYRSPTRMPGHRLTTAIGTEAYRRRRDIHAAAPGNVSLPGLDECFPTTTILTHLDATTASSGPRRCAVHAKLCRLLPKYRYTVVSRLAPPRRRQLSRSAQGRLQLHRHMWRCPLVQSRPRHLRTTACSVDDGGVAAAHPRNRRGWQCVRLRWPRTEVMLLRADWHIATCLRDISLSRPRPLLS